MGRPPKETDAVEVGNRQPIEMCEIGDPGPVEKVSETQFIKEEMALEAFMNEVLTVVVHADTSDNAVENPCPNVNGLNQPFIRGQEQKVKRKYVEALSRSRITRYVQQTPDPSKPENVQMLERTALYFPFSVLHDPNPKGREWLKAILAQPA
jgi:hypothetical protein